MDCPEVARILVDHRAVHATFLVVGNNFGSILYDSATCSSGAK